jgi:hypothetical protein
MIGSLTEQAYVAAEMSWQVMRAPADEEFVIGDHAVTMYDPTLGAREELVGNAIASSPAAETVLPLDRDVAVRLPFDEDEPWVDEEVSAELVREMNLRTWAWAENEIYGSSQTRVVKMREVARRSTQDVARFRPRLSGFVVENEYPKVGGGYRRDVVPYRRSEDRRRPSGR